VWVLWKSGKRGSSSNMITCNVDKISMVIVDVVRRKWTRSNDGSNNLVCDSPK
jgi:hypothetical protein